MQLHFMDTVISVPFLIGIIPIILITAVVLIIVAKTMSSKWFVCDECGTKFKPKWYRALFKPYYTDSNSALLKCPKCKKLRACTESYKQD